MKRPASMFGFLMLLAACATSSPAPKKVAVTHADDVADKPAAEIDPDTVVCETVQVAGSHIPKRVCMTARDREAARQRTQDYLNAQTPRTQRGGN